MRGDAVVVPFQANYVVRLHTKLNRRPNMDARCAFQSTFHFEVVLFVAKGNLNTGWIMLFVSAYSNYNFYLKNFSKNKKFFITSSCGCGLSDRKTLRAVWWVLFRRLMYPSSDPNIRSSSDSFFSYNSLPTHGKADKTE